ncbi:MAG TPA: PrsW family intramembrane metalloprotease [Candidatus Lustribacter sp.]|nr:PrsW family intramembrane metalloprotease [Candidatus Lustribacter sp.]
MSRPRMLRDPAAQATFAAYPAVPNPTRRPLLRRLLLWGLTIIGFLLSAAGLAYAFELELGVRATLVGAATAALPLAAVIPVFLWLDRYEAEPRRLKLFAFGWGALVAPAVAIVLNTGSTQLLRASGVDDAQTLGAVFFAPVTEETTKGLAVLLVFWFARREVDGVIDGLVYAGLAAAGFALSENILYFGRAVAEGSEGALPAVFVLRGIMGPFAHPIFTACTGIGIGIAAVSRSWLVRVVAIAVGWVGAVLLHALWNLSAQSGVQGYLTVYALVQVPLFGAYVGLIGWSRRREGRLIGAHLAPYADAGWLTRPEVAMLASARGRHVARAWARRTGGRRGRSSMQAFQDSASELALLRARVVQGSAGPHSAFTERTLLDAMAAHRRSFGGTPVA